MKALLVAFVVAGASATAAAGEQLMIEAPVFINRADGELTIDREGRVVAFKPEHAWPAGIAARMDGLVRALRFEPVLAEGRPVNARMKMRVTLAATEQASGDMAVRVDNVTFPDEAPQGPCICRKAVYKVLPDYPDVGEMYGVNADVLVVVKVGRDGRIADAAVRQSALIGTKGPPDRVAKVLEKFEQASLRAVRKWRVDKALAPGASATDEQMSAVVPFRFRMERSDETPGRWVLEMRTTKRETPWLQHPPGTPVAGVSDVGGSGLFPAGSRMRLVPAAGDTAL